MLACIFYLLPLLDWLCLITPDVSQSNPPAALPSSPGSSQRRAQSLQTRGCLGGDLHSLMS